jgi:hypothetical protein
LFRIAASLALKAWVASTVCISELRERMCRPTITFSRAVIDPKRRMFWKVLAMPASVTWCTERVEYGLPSSMKLPLSGGYKPVMTLKKVVLPAPLGPIRP